MPYKDPEERRAYGREWMRRNPEKAREAMRRWRQRHPEKHSAETRGYYARHREALLGRMAAYWRAHPEVRRAIHQRRRSRLAGAGGSFTAAEWRSLVYWCGNRCAYCRAAVPLHADHRIPLARGGNNDISNILPACASCNLRKATLTDEEFRERLHKERWRKSID